MINWEI